MEKSSAHSMQVGDVDAVEAAAQKAVLARVGQMARMLQGQVDDLLESLGF